MENEIVEFIIKIIVPIISLAGIVATVIFSYKNFVLSSGKEIQNSIYDFKVKSYIDMNDSLTIFIEKLKPYNYPFSELVKDDAIIDIQKFNQEIYELRGESFKLLEKHYKHSIFISNNVFTKYSDITFECIKFIVNVREIKENKEYDHKLDLLLDYYFDFTREVRKDLHIDTIDNSLISRLTSNANKK